MKSHNELIINHLHQYGEINWMTALNSYYIGGGYRARISEVRDIFRGFRITLDSRSVPNVNNSGEHFEYFLSSDNWKRLKANYRAIVDSLGRKQKQPLTLF